MFFDDEDDGAIDGGKVETPVDDDKDDGKDGEGMGSTM